MEMYIHHSENCMKSFVQEQRFLTTSKVFLLLSPLWQASDIILFWPQPCHKIHEWNVLVDRCGTNASSFSSPLGGIEHNVEEILEDQVVWAEWCQALMVWVWNCLKSRLLHQHFQWIIQRNISYNSCGKFLLNQATNHLSMKQVKCWINLQLLQCCNVPQHNEKTWVLFLSLC